MRIRDDEAIADPEFSMAPLIDVVFQLLIFFMVASSFHKPEQGLDVDLPRAEHGAASGTAQEIVVDVARDGRVFVAGRAEGGDLSAELARAAAGRADVPVIVRGDRLAHHESIVRVLDACSSVGLSNLSLSTVDADGGR